MRHVDVYTCQLVAEQTVEYGSIANVHDAVNVLKKVNAHKRAQESLWVICLGAKGCVTGIHEICRGAVAWVYVPRDEVFRRVLINNATRFIVAHNHPSGSLKPSDEDVALTRTLIDGARIIGLDMLDHVIIEPGGKSYSMQEHGDAEFD